MKNFFLFLLTFAACIFARTPVDTLAWERSDSGARYVKIHNPRSNIVYARFTPDSIPAGAAFQLIDSTKGRGSVYIPIPLAPSRYILDLTAFSGNAATTWAYVLKLDTTTLFSATATSSSLQIRNLEFFADTARSRIYLRRTIVGATTIGSAIDSATFTRWNVVNKVSWTVNPSTPARLYGVSGRIEQ